MNDPILFDINSVPVDFDMSAVMRYYQETGVSFINRNSEDNPINAPIIYSTAGEISDLEMAFGFAMATKGKKFSERVGFAEVEEGKFLGNIER